MAFRAELAEAMERACMTPEAVCVEMAKLGEPVTAGAVHQWLSGRREPQGRKLVTLAHVLGVAADDLMQVGAG